MSRGYRGSRAYRRLSCLSHTLAHTFPFGVLFAVAPDLIFMVAVPHLSRKPGYWRDRLTDIS